MISSAECNIYEVNAATTLAIFEAFVEGEPSDVALALSAEPLGDGARRALRSSLAALGYGTGALAFATCRAEGTELGAKECAQVVEGLDPLVVIACDEPAAHLLEGAFRTPCPLDAACRVNGRDVVAFRDFSAMLGKAEDKQRAWALLKKLPKLMR